MNSKHRFFLVIEGLKDGYPNVQSAIVHFVEKDPASVKYDNLFVCSPLFSILPEGVKSIPRIDNNTIITFIMAPKIFPHFGEIIEQFPISNDVWFSLGLANLVVIESAKNKGITKKIIAHLKNCSNLIAFEEWRIKDSKVIKFPKTTLVQKDTSVVNTNVKISPNLPLYLKFSVSEYIISIEKFLTASKKFTPQYYPKHLATITQSIEVLINDLCFLFGDNNYTPSESLLISLKEGHPDKAATKLKKDSSKQLKEELINERHSRLIQFNSSMSYIYSQAYSGIFPIFDHIGIVRRHSLLGIGTAIGALFELISQLEGALCFLPFESLDSPIYDTTKIPSVEYIKFFKDPAKYNSIFWSGDELSNKIIKENKPEKGKVLPDDFYNRLSFYSGRLGFREYEFSATAAIQVLVESHSLKWHVINYTHEIIHNHVRMILNELLLPIKLSHDVHKEWANNYLKIIYNVYKNYLKLDKKISYRDYYAIVLLNFCINSDYFGSLSNESDPDLITKRRNSEFKLPKAEELDVIILELYKDISEIFVHVIDFTYIYNRNVNEYISSIWTSWSTVPSVASDIKHYIIRTLIIISLLEKGEVKYRYEKSKKRFLSILGYMAAKGMDEYIFSRIKEILKQKDTLDDKDIRQRFYNCVIVSDLVNNCFVGEIQDFLDNDDKNKIDNSDILYIVETNSFNGNEIKNKVRFLLDQLIRTINCPTSEVDDQKERTSAWLLLSLSTYNK